MASLEGGRRGSAGITLEKPAIVLSKAQVALVAVTVALSAGTIGRAVAATSDASTEGKETSVVATKNSKTAGGAGDVSTVAAEDDPA